jgi:dTDP-L-rhamnose 4-epimerase
MTKVLVTGGAGFIGSHLVDRFLQDDFAVRVLDNLDPKVHPFRRPAYLPAKVEFIEGSVTDREVLRHALRGVDVVSHQAAYQDYMPDFSRFLSVNGVGTALIYELIVQERLPVKKVIVASSQAVYGEGQYDCPVHGFLLPTPRSHRHLAHRQWEVVCPDCGHPAKPRLLEEQHTNPYNQYAVSKLAQEKTALGLGWLHGIPTVALRYSVTQGPRQSLFNHYSGICRIFVSRAFTGGPMVIYEDGLQTRDFVHVQDVVDANMLALENDAANAQAFNVGSGRSTSVNDYARLVREKIGSKVEVRIPGEYRTGDNRHSVSSISKLNALGWAPRRSLSDILNDFLEWIQRSGGIPEKVPDAYSHMKESGVVLAAGH